MVRSGAAHDRAPGAAARGKIPARGVDRAEEPGLNDFQRHQADLLAELRYVTRGFNLHGGHRFTYPEEMLARVTPMLADPDPMRGIGHAALDVVRAEPRSDRVRICREQGADLPMLVCPFQRGPGDWVRVVSPMTTGGC